MARCYNLVHFLLQTKARQWRSLRKEQTNEIAILGRWITAGWARKPEVQRTTRRLFGKVVSKLSTSVKIYECITWMAIQLCLFLSYKIQGQKQLEYLLLKFF